MSNNQIVIDTLNQKILQLQSERDKMLDKYNAEIAEVASAILELSGQAVSLSNISRPYDDESPDHIRGNEDGI